MIIWIVAVIINLIGIRDVDLHIKTTKHLNKFIYVILMKQIFNDMHYGIKQLIFGP